MEKKHHARTLPHTGHVKNSDEGSPDFVVGQFVFRMCCFFIFKALFLFSFPIWIVKTYVVRVQHGADSASHERFFGLIITHRPDLCQIGGMSSPDKKDSFRVIYFKN
jgi:hypothetical protein